MIKLKFLSQLTIISFVVLSLPVMASPKIALGPKISTLGAGPEAEIEIIESCTFRLGLNTFQYSKKIKRNQIN